MKKIYKEVITTNEQTINLPIGAKILTAQVQGPSLCIWYLFDEAVTEKEPRYLKIYPTGCEVDSHTQNLYYIATFQWDGGALIGHLFEIIEKPEFLI